VRAAGRWGAALLGLALALGAAGPAGAQGVPPAGIQAEVARRWDDAIRIYRAVLAEDPGRVDLWLRIADIEAAVGRPERAAEALEAAARGAPGDAAIHARLSQAQAALDRPGPALVAISRAVALDPGNAEYLRARALIANWTGDYGAAEDSYRRLLARDPDDAPARLGLARARRFGGKLEGAVRDYREYVRRRRDDPAGRLELAQTEAYRGNYAGALRVLDAYRDDLGESQEAAAFRGRVLAWARRAEAALRVIDPLLARDPGNRGLEVSRTLALAAGRQLAEAAESLRTLERRAPDDREVKDLGRLLGTPLRSSVTPRLSFYSDSDQLRVLHAAVEGDLGIRPHLRLQAALETDDLRAPRGSGLEQRDGDRQARHARGSVGAVYQLGPALRLDARLGAADADGDRQLASYRVGLDAWVGDQWRFRIERDYGFYVISPRTVGLGIRRGANQAEVVWEPAIEYHVTVLAGHATFSDGNERWEVVVAPRRAVLRSQHLNLDLGLRAWWYGFDRDLDNGYYDPAFFQRYSVTAFAYWKLADNHGVSAIASLGAGKDDAARGFDFAGEALLAATFGIFSDWQLRLAAAYSYNRLPSGAFDGVSASVALTRRF
jgi:tetratricopeptide (TPR) repeat protein